MAADRNFEISILLGTVDRATADFQQLQKQVRDTKADMTSAGLAIGAFGAAITAALGMAVKAAAEQELALNKLQTAVELSGLTWMDAKVQIDNYVASMQALTIFGDTDMFPVIQNMLLYTQDMNTALEATTISLDMAASGFFNLETASKYVGMALAGNVEMLGRYIPELRGANLETLGLTTETEKADYALGLLRDKFGGMSSDQLKTFNGQMLQLKAYFSDLVETIGSAFLPMLTTMAKDFTDIVKSIQTWVNENQALVNILLSMVGNIGLVSTAIGAMLIVIPQLTIAITALWAVMSAHPLIALAAGLTILLGLGADYLANLVAEMSLENELYASMLKRHDTMVNQIQAEINWLKFKLTQVEEGSAEEEALLWKLWMAEKSIQDERKKIHDETNAKMKAANIDYYDGWLNIIDQAYNQIAIKEYELAQNHEQWYSKITENTKIALMAITDTTLKEEMTLAEKIKFIYEGTNAIISNFYELQKTHIANWKEDAIAAEDEVYQVIVEKDVATRQSALDLYNKNKNLILTTVEDAEEMEKQLAELDTSYYSHKEQLLLNEQKNQDAHSKALIEIDKHTKEEARKAANIMKQIMIAQVIANTAGAIMKTFAYYGGTPFAWISAGLIAAEGATQWALINAQRYATGGRNITGGFALVGEEGPELLNLPTGSDVYSNRESMSMLGGKPSIIISGNNFYGTGGLEQLVDMISEVQLERVQDARNF